MWLTRLAIDRPFITALMCAVLLFGGLFSGLNLPVDLNPKADLATLTITCIYPGASPANVETSVAKPLEECLKSVARLDHLMTISQDSVCYSFAEFSVGTDSGEAQDACREAISAARSRFPAGMLDPVLAKLDINAQPVLFLGVSGPRSPEELRSLAKDVVEPRLRSVRGVTAVEVLGGREREVHVEIDREKLLSSGLTITRVAQVVEGANVNVPGGNLERGNEARGVRLVGRFANLDDVRGVPLPPPDDPGRLIEQAMRPQAPHQPNRALRLGDIATVALRAVEPEVRVRLQQAEAVGIIVTKRGDGNTIRIAREALAAAQSAPLPEGVKIIVARDQARTVSEALTDVNVSLALAVLLCAAAILLFLRNARATAIVCTTIPVCLLGALAPMAWGGHTINQMTLLGLAISIGILVDDSIVCIEAITHRLQQGEPAAEAAFNGRNDIALADTSTTLLDVAVYGPIAFMAGTVGQFFRDFGFVVAVTAGLSLFAAYTIVPSMAARFYRDRPPSGRELEQSPALERLTGRYHVVLEWALRHRGRTLIIGWTGLALAGLLAWQCLGIDLIPAADLSTIAVNIELPGAAGAKATEQTVASAEKLIGAIPEVDTLFTTLGRIEVGFGVVSRMGPRYAQINVTLRDKRGMVDRLTFRGRGLRTRSDDAVAAEVRTRLRAIPAANFQVIAVHGWGGAGAPVDFSLYGKDAALLAAAGVEALEGLRTMPGLLDPDVAWRLGEPEVQVEMQRDRARELYIYPGVVAQELRASVAGTDAGTFEQGDDVLPVKVRLRPVDRRGESDLARIPVGRSASRELTIGDVASLRSAAGPTRIDRRDGVRDLNFKAYLAAGVSLGEAQKAITAMVTRLGVASEKDPASTPSAKYAGLRWGWRGDAATMAESTKYMVGTGLLGLTLAYLVMAVLFNSALHPLTILLSVPMAGTGGLLLLAVTGSSLSIVSGIGFILLIGIVVRNAILLIDYTLQLRAQGVERHHAVVQAGLRRLRPILMTTFTTTVGMLPVALGLGKGAEIRSPMAVAVIGGLLLSTLLTLVIIPVTYTLLDDWFGRP
ncbi:MAG: efflux RND transporter permease subunit [Armatimonadetes bacterium]|nr:efflux RND transporter permease subunit [Armatimonadota bacterium]